MPRKFALLVLLAVAIPLGLRAADVDPPAAWGDWRKWGDQGDGTYRNPVLPGDFSDLDVIRVGGDFYAISSTMQMAPGMAVLHSKDLVNWRILGHAVNDLTEIGPELNWDRMRRYGRGVWAGAIRFHAGKFWVYFCTPDEGTFMTTATNPAGPWTSLHRMRADTGWDDCCPFWDDDGQGYLVTTNYAGGYKIHLFKLTPDGRDFAPGFDVVLYAAKGSEANKLFKRGGYYYHYFSEVAREGRVPMIGRAKAIAGPYERRQILHVNKARDHEPNQGGLVDTPAGDWFFFTHHGAGDWSGRGASLLPVKWVNDWPVIGEPTGDGIGAMTWSGGKPVKGTPVVTPQTSDDFDQPTLALQWEWNHQPRAGKWSLTERPGFLRLRAFRPLRPDDLSTAGNTLTQRSYRTAANVVTVHLEIEGMADGQVAGLCHFNPRGWAEIGVAQDGSRRALFFRAGQTLVSGPEITAKGVWFRSTWGLDGLSQFAYSLDGRTFLPLGTPHQLMWGSYRGDRVGLFSYNNKGDAGWADFDRFRHDFSGPGGKPLIPRQP